MRRAAGLALVLCALVSFGACGRHAMTPPIGAARPSIQSANCDAWRLLPSAGRSTLLAGLHDFFGAPVDATAAPSAGGPVLTTEAANRLFDTYCGQPFAGAFKLYKIYGRAAAFTPSR